MRTNTLTNFAKRIVLLLFALMIYLCSYMNIEASSDSSNILFTTKWKQPTSTDTSAVYTEFATRVANNGQISVLEVYYVLTQDSNLVCHIMDNDLNIIASSNTVATRAGSGIQKFIIPDYTYTAENMYIALESDKQSIGVGTVQDISSVSASVTANNTVSGIQNAQRISQSSTLSKVNGTTRNGISLYIKAYGTISENSDNLIVANPVPTYKSGGTSTEEKNLFNTKWQYPTSTDKSVLYSGIASRVVNIGTISRVEIYYVLTENSNLTCRLLDTNLNTIVSSSAVATKAGTGMQTFTFPAYSYSGSEMYISLESDRRSLGVGCGQDSGTALSCVTANNMVSGKQNAFTYSPDKPLSKISGGTVKQSFTLYIKVYGQRTDIPVETASTTNSSITKNVYISVSSGVDEVIAGSKSHPYKTLSYAIKQNGNNTIYSLKCSDTFYLRYGIELTDLSNIVLNSYGTGTPPSICGLVAFTPKKVAANTYTSTFSERETGVLFINSKPFWKRKTLDANLTDNASYYFDKATSQLKLNYNSPITSAYFAAPYSGIMVSHCSNVVIEGLTVSFYGRHGIRVFDNCSNVTVRNNTIHNIGGVPTTENIKYGNGIELWMTNLSDIYVQNNVVYNCFDAGLTAQVQSASSFTNTNLQFTNNTVSNCRYNFEYFNSGNSNTTCTVTVANNILNNCMDITGGYREKAGTAHGSFLCLWNSEGARDSIAVSGNVCTSSDSYGIAFRDDTYGKIKVNNNVFTGCSNAILNPQFLYGSNNTFK
ncbi:right-handed parallel beta-helix repeat-containing protein [Pseudobutyrivibrio xylanivorans]|uniref:Right handed beta helix region n=1 Tax=Pseudobutyrivibrio xylanivorans TaxID=185007 RepID=A0A1G5RZX1_PSEXY|nr:right-handed parallel beta-helix repeat-containing protein [Pseudobutyrivibrio xylanivorans]SCZ79695.1 Right handed beta helix region [Pseudobutyrivibrio xylanivorans]